MSLSDRSVSPSIVREDEQRLVHAAQNGDSAAFEELVARYDRRIFRITRNITGNQEDAEDAMQEAFLKAYAHLKGFQGGSRFYTWLVRIAVNESLMRLRRRRPNHFSIDEPLPGKGDSEGMPLELEDWDPNPEQKYAHAEITNILSGFIEQMDIAYRSVLVLRDVDELSTQETADALGLSVGGVKTRLSRARLMLRENLNAYFRRGGLT